MKIEKVNGLFLRVKLADGTLGKDEFVVSMLTDGSGILLEFDSEKYLLRTEEIVKEILKKARKEK